MIRTRGGNEEKNENMNKKTRTRTTKGSEKENYDRHGKR